MLDLFCVVVTLIFFAVGAVVRARLREAGEGGDRMIDYIWTGVVSCSCSWST